MGTVVRIKSSGTGIDCKNSCHLIDFGYLENENTRLNYMVQALAGGYPLLLWRLNASINPLGLMTYWLCRWSTCLKLIIWG